MDRSTDTAHPSERVLHVAEQIAAELALEPLLTRLVERAVALIGAQYGSIGLVHEDATGPVVEIAAVVNMPASERGTVIPRDVGLAGRVLRLQQPLRLNRYGDLDQPTLPEYAEHAVIGVPIWWRDRMIGFWGIGAEPPRRFADDDVAMLTLLARHAAVAIENARRFEAERRRAARSAVINQIGQSVSSSLSLHNVFQSAVDAIHEQLGFAYVAAGLIDNDDPTMLVLYAHAGVHAALVPPGYRQRIDHGIVGAAARTRERILVTDVHGDARYLPLLEPHAIVAELAVPIMDGDHVLGVLNVESERPLDEYDADGVVVVADQLAIAIRNARRYENEQHRTARLALIARLGQRIAARLDAHDLFTATTTELHTQLGYQHVSLFLIDKQAPDVLVQYAHASAWPRPEEIGYRQPITHGLLGEAARTRRPALVHDVAADGRYVPIPGAPPHMSELAVPITLDDRLLGVLDVAGTKPLDGDDVATMEIVAGQLAVATDNARRYNEERHRTERLQMIARVSQRIAARLDPDELFPATVEELHGRMGYDHAALFLLDPDDPGFLVKRATASRWPGRPAGYRQAIGDGLMGAAARERRAVLVNDVRRDERFVPVPGGTAMRAELATPIVLGERLIGVLDVGSTHALGDEDVMGMRIVADQLAVAIDNAELFGQTQQLAVLQERQRLARDLHDSVTQQLFSLTLLAQALAPAWRRSAQEGEERVTRVLDVSQTALAEMRALLRELHPPATRPAPALAGPHTPSAVLERDGLVAALHAHADHLERDGFTVALDIGAYVPQDHAHEAALFRVAQEALHNVVKHAHTEHATVRLAATETTVELCINDHGIGFRPDTPARAGGSLGLRSMHERVAALRGTLQITTAAGEGTTVHAVVPRNDRS